MALYSIYQNSIHNIELCHDCYAISIVYQSMLWLFMSYAKDVVRSDDLGISVRCAFGLALAFYLSIRRVGDLIHKCVTLGMKYRIPSTEPNLPRTEPKVPKPKYSVPCSVPSFGEPKLPRYIRFCISVNRSTELVPNYASSSSCYVFVMYLWTTLLHIYSNLLM